MPQVKPSPLLRYGFAVLMVALAAFLTWFFPLLGNRIPFALFYAAVMVSAWYGGREAGLLSVALSALSSAYLFLSPSHSLAIGGEGVLLLSVFILVSLVIVWLTEKVKRAELKARTSQEELLITLKSIGDAVIATDERSRVTFLNEVAQELTGWTLEEAQGKELREVFKIVNQETREEVESPVTKVIREGVIVGLANHTILIAKDGKETPIDDSGAPIKDEEGNIMGVVLVFRDIAEQRRTEVLRNRLAALVESSEDAIIGKTLDGIITNWNASAERLYGYTAEEVVGRHISLLVPANRPDEVPGIHERLKRGERIERFETRRVTKDGRVLDISLTISPIKDSEGTIVGAATIARDITEQKHSQAALRESEERLRQALESARMGTWEWNMQTGEITWSDTLEPLHGLAPGSFKGTFEAFNELIHPEDRELLSRAVARAAEEGTAYDLDFRIVWPDGTIRWMEGKGRIFLDEEGKPERMTGLGMDITERKQAQESLRESEERYRAFVSNSSEAIWRFELEEPVPVELPIAEQIELYYQHGYLGECNDAMAEMYGFRRAEEIVGARLDDLLVRDDPRNVEYLRSFIESGYRLTEAESHEVDKEGRPKYFLNNLVGIIEDGKLMRAWGTQRDITERHMAEEALRESEAREKAARVEAENANRTKDEFLATLSHELRTPLTAMLGWTKMLRMRDLDETTSALALETVERNAKAQAQLIEDLLDVSRIITGNLRLDARPVELLPVIEAAIDSVRPAAEAKGIGLRTFLDPLAGLVSGDPARLQQIVWNLLSNAVKFTKEGEVRVRLERANSQVEISVSDTGQGIKSEFLPFVFDRFRQADSSTTRMHGGLGLGLAIVRHLVELHGGTVHAESEGPGRGATFKVKFPLMAVRISDFGFRHEEPDSEESAARASQPSMLAGWRLLVVDDEPDARELMRTVLEKQGASVTTAGSADEALEVFEREKPDVLISDIGMPGADGYDLIRRIRARGEAEGGNVPAAAVSAYVGEENRRQALAAGFQIHVAKPLDPSELVAVVQSLKGSRQ
ncbi:MAG TPA: PAS domain S-box protein [Pyrinomonadaceae bacterium]